MSEYIPPGRTPEPAERWIMDRFVDIGIAIIKFGDPRLGNDLTRQVSNERNGRIVTHQQTQVSQEVRNWFRKLKRKE